MIWLGYSKLVRKIDRTLMQELVKRNTNATVVLAAIAIAKAVSKGRY